MKRCGAHERRVGWQCGRSTKSGWLMEEERKRASRTSQKQRAALQAWIEGRRGRRVTQVNKMHYNTPNKKSTVTCRRDMRQKKRCSSSFSLSFFSTVAELDPATRRRTRGVVKGTLPKRLDEEPMQRMARVKAGGLSSQRKGFAYAATVHASMSTEYFRGSRWTGQTRGYPSCIPPVV